jgi:hypothetical protein
LTDNFFFWIFSPSRAKFLSLNFEEGSLSETPHQVLRGVNSYARKEEKVQDIPNLSEALRRTPKILSQFVQAIPESRL